MQQQRADEADPLEVLDELLGEAAASEGLGIRDIRWPGTAEVTWLDVWRLLYQHQHVFSDDDAAALLPGDPSRRTVSRRRAVALDRLRLVIPDLRARVGEPAAARAVAAANRLLDRTAAPLAAPPVEGA